MSTSLERGRPQIEKEASSRIPKSEWLLNSIPCLRIPHSYGQDPDIKIASHQLDSFGARPELIRTLFDTDGRFRYRDTHGANFLDMRPDNAYDYLTNVLSPIYEAISLYLDEPTTKRRPYNDHGENHVKFVWETSIGLYREYLASGGKPQLWNQETDELTLSMAAPKHDAGYFLDPDRHPEASIVLTERIFPQLSSVSIENQEIVDKSYFLVRNHEGGAFRKLMKAKRLNTYEEILAFLEKEPLLAAISLADKLHHKADRVREAEVKTIPGYEPLKTMGDSNIELSLVLPITDYGDRQPGPEDDPNSGSTFYIEYTFDQTPPEDQADRLKSYMVPSFKRPGGRKLSVSKDTKSKNANGGGQEYFDSEVEKYLIQNATKMVRMALFALPLNPNRRKVEFMFFDKQRGTTEKFEFRKNNFHADVEAFWSRVPDEIRNDRSAFELKI